MSIFNELQSGVLSESAEETRALSARLALELAPGSILALHGDLGCGKTTFVSGMADSLGIAEPVTSPSYNLFTIYKGKTGKMLAHLDAYRLGAAEDMDTLMIEEFLVDPWIMAIEWPEKIEGWLPEDAIHIHFEDYGEKQRKLQIR